MNKILLIIIAFFIANCSLNKVVKHHGVPFLEKKQEKLSLHTSNKNDIIKLLGPPSTRSTFDNDLWIYVERKLTNSNKLLKFGQKELVVNNVLILELDTMGLLVNKEFYNKEKMEDLKFSKEQTEIYYNKRVLFACFFNIIRYIYVGGNALSQQV